MPTDESPLAGVCVLVTRPRDQADSLVRRIEAAGGRALRFPTIDIAPVELSPALRALLAALDGVDLAIFISANAVNHGLARVQETGRPWPATVRVAAVGQTTAQALATSGFIDVLVPTERFDSEALLALPALQDVRAKRILIFRGQGGREHLAEILRARGALVDYVECYRRVPPATDPGVLIGALQRGEVHIITLTSVDAARYLRDTLGDDARRIRGLPAVVASQRIADAIVGFGLELRTLVAPAATDTALLEALQRWRASQKNL